MPCWRTVSQLAYHGSMESQSLTVTTISLITIITTLRYFSGKQANITRTLQSADMYMCQFW